MKITSLAVLLFMVASWSWAGAQDIWMTRTAEITFFSTTPVEDIEAENDAVTVIFKANTGELAFKVLMKSFQFDRAAMQDHFNKDYLHTDDYPQATFKGAVVDMDAVDLSKDGTYKVQVLGELNIHGVINKCKHAGIIEVKGGKVKLHSKFKIHLPDYNVRVPANFVKSISKDIEITVNASMEPYER